MLSNTDLQTSFRQGNVLSSNTLIASEVIFKYNSGEHLWLCKNFCCETSDWDHCWNVFRCPEGLWNNFINTLRCSTWWGSPIQPVPIFIVNNFKWVYFDKWGLLPHQNESSLGLIRLVSSTLYRCHSLQIRIIGGKLPLKEKKTQLESWVMSGVFCVVWGFFPSSLKNGRWTEQTSERGWRK